MPRRNDRYEDAYSNSDSVTSKRRTVDSVRDTDRYGTRVFGSSQTPPAARRKKAPVKRISLAAVNASLTIIIVALLVCLVILLGIYSTVNL